MGTGTQYRSWITLEDEIGVVLQCLGDDGLQGPVNATAPEPATDAELAHAVGAVLHRPTAMVVPAAALRLVLGAEMAGQLVLGGQRVLPRALESRDFPFAHPSLVEAVRSVLAPTD
jgi:NAD dependent epimerase/dehydratase family enzyme